MDKEKKKQKTHVSSFFYRSREEREQKSAHNCT